MQTEVVNEVKIISAVLPNEKIEHDGDLLVEGDVGESAKVIVKNGCLKILGSVKKGANVDCSDPDALTKIGGVNSIHRGCTVYQGSYEINYTSGTNSYLKGRIVDIYTNVLFKDSNSKLCIDTPDILTIVADNYYEITPKNTSGYAQATIEGKRYDAKFIKVVNGIVSVVEANPSEINCKPKKNCKIIIKGNIEDLTVLKFDELQFAGDVGNYCTIESQLGGFSAQNIGEKTKITVAKEINALSIGNNSTITSSAKSVNIKKIGRDSTISASESIKAEDVDFGCTLTSSCRNIEIRGVCGDEVKISASEEVICQKVGKNAQITSSCRSVNIKTLGESSTVTASDKIIAVNVGSWSRLTSECREVLINGTCGDHVTINANQLVVCKSTGKNATIDSSSSSVDIGTLGDDSIVTASETITADNVGSKSRLTSSCKAIIIDQTCGEGVTLSASGDVTCKNVGKNARITSASGAVTIGALLLMPVKVLQQKV